MQTDDKYHIQREIELMSLPEDKDKTDDDNNNQRTNSESLRGRRTGRSC